MIMVGYGTKKAVREQATRAINAFKSNDSTLSLFWSKILPYSAPPVLASSNQNDPPQPQLPPSHPDVPPLIPAAPEAQVTLTMTSWYRGRR